MLHVTNGDSSVAVLRAAGAEGEILPWRDVLHDGPVPGGADPAALRAIRARFLAPRAPGSEAAVLADMTSRDERLDAAARDREPVMLWFEDDLFDVLLLMQVLDRVPAGAPVRLVVVGQDAWRSVTGTDPAELARLGRTAPELEAAQHEVARAAWAAFTAARPDGLEPLAAGTPALPAVGHAVRRLLEEYPARGSGLSRTERQLLEALAGGARTRTEAFLAATRAEERPFLGDASAWDALDRLAPLLDGAALNDHGRDVLSGRRRWEPEQERWIGGVRLPPGAPPWCWDAEAARLVSG